MIHKEAGRNENFKSMLAGTPEGKLILSILIQTLHDATKNPSKRDIKHNVQVNAIKFLLEDSPMLNLCMWIADCPIEEMRDILWKKGFSKESYKLIYNYLVGKRPDQNRPIVEEDDDEEDYSL